MLWVLLSLVTFAFSAPEALVHQRLEETKHLRSLRMVDELPIITEKDYKKAIKGDIATGLQSVEGFAAKKAFGVGIMDVPISDLWAALNDERIHAQWTPLSYAELVGGEYCKNGRRIFMFLPIPIVTDRWWISVVRSNERLRERSAGRVRELTWTSSSDPTEIKSAKGKEVLAEGIPIKYTKGAWYLTGLDEKSTLAEYYVWTDPGGRIPAGAATMFAAGSVRDTFKAMLKATRSGTAQCPP